MNERAEHSEPRRYDVGFNHLDGSRKVITVITNRGPLKAVYLAAATIKSVLGKAPLDVTAEDVGAVELDAHGVAKLDAHIIDRQEW